MLLVYRSIALKSTLWVVYNIVMKGAHAAPPQAGVLDLLTSEGWKTESTLNWLPESVGVELNL